MIAPAAIVEADGGPSRATTAIPIDPDQRPARGLRVTIVAANTFEFDSRFLRTALTLADEGHDVTILALAGEGLPAEEAIAPRVRLSRLDIDQTISSAFRPLPDSIRAALCRAIGVDPVATVLPPDEPRGVDRLRHPLRRSVETLAALRRARPWADAAVRAAPSTDVFHCQSLVVLPAVRRAARRLGAGFVYDVADYHVGTERLSRMPWIVRELVRRRERELAREAAGFLAVSDPVADLVARRWDVPRPAVLLNCPPAWLPTEARPPRRDVLRRTISVPTDRPLVLYQGGFSVDRGIEELLAAIERPELRALDAAAVFLGYGRLRPLLDEEARRRPDRLFVLPAVPPDELLTWTSGADVAYIGQPARTPNWRMNLPNKLFESLMAGVPVVVSSGNEQCRLVRLERVGACTAIEPDAIGEAVGRLLRLPPDEMDALRQRCRTVALERYTWDANAGGLTALYRRLAADTGAMRT